jgi:hypothetical protein
VWQIAASSSWSMVDDDDGIMLSFAVGGILKKWQWVF